MGSSPEASKEAQEREEAIVIPYADTDFLLALLKPSDWLKDSAEHVLKAKRGNIKTSIIAVAETLMVGRALGLNPERMISGIIGIVRLEEEDERASLKAAIFMSRYGLSTFDAFHAALAEDNEIISSNTSYDKLGIKRISI